MTLQPETDATVYGVGSVCGGFAIGSRAIIFVRRFPASVPEPTRLAYVIANEMGHILLGPNAHSVAGIMRRPTLLSKDWAEAAQGALGFTRSQARQIQIWILGRSMLYGQG